MTHEWRYAHLPCTTKYDSQAKKQFKERYPKTTISGNYCPHCLQLLNPSRAVCAHLVQFQEGNGVTKDCAVFLAYTHGTCNSSTQCQGALEESPNPTSILSSVPVFMTRIGIAARYYCTVSDCSHRRKNSATTSLFCETHSCQKCFDRVERPSNYCLNHTCRVKNCTNLRVSAQKAKYCSRHVCSRKGCQNRQLNGLQFCKSCEQNAA